MKRFPCSTPIRKTISLRFFHIGSERGVRSSTSRTIRMRSEKRRMSSRWKRGRSYIRERRMIFLPIPNCANALRETASYVPFSKKIIKNRRICPLLRIRSKPERKRVRRRYIHRLRMRPRFKLPRKRPARKRARQTRPQKPKPLSPFAMSAFPTVKTSSLTILIFRLQKGRSPHSPAFRAAANRRCWKWRRVCSLRLTAKSAAIRVPLCAGKTATPLFSNALPQTTSPSGPETAVFGEKRSFPS